MNLDSKIQPHLEREMSSMKISRTSPLLVSTLWILAALRLAAAVDDEFVGEQMNDISGIPEAEKSFWDPTFWRDMTAPLESPVVPGPSQWLYFGRKGFDGTPTALPATGLTLFTAARNGFAPPAITPAFAQVYFSGDEIVFDGTPGLPADPVGRFVVAAPHQLSLNHEAKIDFDRTVVDAAQTQIIGSLLTLTGEVAPYNFRSLGNLGIQRGGAQTFPSLQLRSNAIAELASFQYSFLSGPSPAVDNTAVSIESGAHLQASSVLLTHPGGKVFDASAGRGRATLGAISVTGHAPETDPAVLFHATGVTSPVSAFSVTNQTILDGFRGTLAHVEDGATMDFNDIIYAVGSGGRMGLRANREGAINMHSLSTSTSATSGSTQLDWIATTQGSISLTQVMLIPLHLNNQAHGIYSLSGGKIDIPTSLGLDPGGRLLFNSSGAGSELRLDSNTDFTPHNYLADSLARWERINLTITDGGMLRGGETTDLGGGNYYADSRSIYVHKTTSMSNLTVSGASVKNVGMAFVDAQVTAELGTAGNPATLNQFSINVGDGSFLTMRGGTWQPERVEMATASQSLQVGDRTGGSVGSITDEAVCHSLDILAGHGVFRAPGDPVPAVANSIVTIDGGSTVTGSLAAAQYDHGKGSVNIAGEFTNCGFRNVQLGVTSNPMFGGQSGGGGPPSFTGEFFSSPGGQSSLHVTSGARVSIGAFEGAYGQWQQPDNFSPAYLSANAAPISIGATSAIYLGNAANAAARDFRNGALVVGPGGYMIGTGNVIGSLINNGGEIRPGFSPGSIDVDGDFSMEAGTLVLEVKSNTPGGWDALIANSITITGGTIIIRPAAGYDSGTGINVDLFQSASLSIAPGVTVQIAPELGTAAFNPATGAVSIVGGSEHDLNFNHIDDRLEAVLPSVAGSLEWPVLQQPVGAAPVLVFRRKAPSLFSHDLMVQWSNDLVTWTDIPIPFSSEGAVTIIPDDIDLYRVEVTLPPPSGGNPKIFTRLSVRKSGNLFF